MLPLLNVLEICYPYWTCWKWLDIQYYPSIQALHVILQCKFICCKLWLDTNFSSNHCLWRVLWWLVCLVVACWDGQCLQFLCQEACDLCLGVWPRSSVSVAEGAYKVTLSDWTLFYTALLWSLHDNACVAGIRVFEKLDFMIQEENTCWPSSRVAKVRSRISKLSDIMFIYIYYTSPVWPIWPFKKVGTLQTTFFQGTLFAKYFLMKRRFQNSTFLFFTHLSLFLLLLHQPWRWEVFHPPEESMSIDCHGWSGSFLLSGTSTNHRGAWNVDIRVDIGGWYGIKRRGEFILGCLNRIIIEIFSIFYA